ncbi:MAG: type 1 glutamine amidotransferase domain-containing protein [Candidatus Nanohaloarchaea archaeon]|nr:type 1 glutamine amidotransferase domain-containing protein [Candidatus Nanohaloarchaea archaeon]
MDAAVAILVEDGHQDREFWYPNTRLKEAGAEVDVVSREDRQYESEHGYPVEPDATIDEVDTADYDAVVIPGGRECPDRLRRDEEVLDFVRAMDEQDSIVAAICHAGWVPASAGILNGRQATCYHSISDDVANAGADYVDEEVVVDGNLITSRHPGDLPAFLGAILDGL